MTESQISPVQRNNSRSQNTPEIEHATSSDDLTQMDGNSSGCLLGLEIVYFMPRSESDGLSPSSRSLLVLGNIFYNECYDRALKRVLILRVNTCRTVQYAEFTSILFHDFLHDRHGGYKNQVKMRRRA